MFDRFFILSGTEDVFEEGLVDATRGVLGYLELVLEISFFTFVSTLEILLFLGMSGLFKDVFTIFMIFSYFEKRVPGKISLYGEKEWKRRK